MFVRRYSEDTRPWIGFHQDGSIVTVNVALDDDAEHEGGRLFVVLDDGITALSRTSGEVTAHVSNVLHAVSLMKGGVRYSLLLFFYHANKPEPAPGAS
eukprot:7281511-Prymnesium_polylepis.1